MVEDCCEVDAHRLALARLHERVVLDAEHAGHRLGRAHRLAGVGRGIDRSGERHHLLVGVDVQMERVEAGARQLGLDLRR